MVPRHRPAPLAAEIRRPRRARPEVAPLEGRSLLTILSFTAGASAMRLVRYQPGQLQHNPVGLGRQGALVLSGQVITDSPTPPTVTFQVIDQFHQDMPHGPIPANFPYLTRPPGPDRIFPFSRRVVLDLAHPLTSPNGRQYTFLVTARDQNSVQTQEVIVDVPRVNFFFGPVRHQIRVL